MKEIYFVFGRTDAFILLGLVFAFVVLEFVVAPADCHFRFNFIAEALPNRLFLLVTIQFGDGQRIELGALQDDAGLEILLGPFLGLFRFIALGRGVEQDAAFRSQFDFNMLRLDGADGPSEYSVLSSLDNISAEGNANRVLFQVGRLFVLFRVFFPAGRRERKYLFFLLNKASQKTKQRQRQEQREGEGG